MIFQQCPICGRYMIPNMSETSGWYQCVCGYDSRSYVYTYTNHSSDFGYGEKERRTTRLIDADKLALKLRYMGYMDEHEEVQEVIDEAPTVDAVEVVRCKDCRYYVTNYAVPHCGRTLIGMKKSDYCNYGERKKIDVD